MTTDELPETFYEGTLEPLQPLAVIASDPLVAALNRLATAVEQATLAMMDQRAQAPTPASPLRELVGPHALAPLPPVRQDPRVQEPVNTRIACPTHGSDKVKSSSKKGQNFYCSGKMNDGTWCKWSV